MSQSIDIEIAEIYNERFLKLGPVPEASMWYSRKRQFARFDVIIEQIKLLATNETVTITDIGCGYGAFLEFLLERKFPNAWRYYGHDLSQEVVEFCKKNIPIEGHFILGLYLQLSQISLLCREHIIFFHLMIIMLGGSIFTNH